MIKIEVVPVQSQMSPLSVTGVTNCQAKFTLPYRRRGKIQQVFVNEACKDTDAEVCFFENDFVGYETFSRMIRG
jgi:hypothetical protein